MSAASFQALLQQGEQLQQRAERKRGAAAASLFAEATAKFKAAIALAASGAASPAPDDYAAAWFGAAESLHEGAEAGLAACAQLPDAQLTAAAAQQADAQAEALLRESVEAYRRVQEGGQPRVDALVCCGNALSSWAEVAARRDAPAAAALLQQAAESYRAALAREEDALTLSNLADAGVQRAALLCEAGQGEAGGAAFGDAMAAYQRACGLSDAEQGDDLPGLLLNWSRGLLAMAQHAQDRSLALRLLDEAGQRLQRTIEFLRGSEEPFLALGDVLLERGEQQAAAGDAGAAAASLRAALDEGYGRVARIKANHPEAAVGAGDVHVQLARLAAGAGGGEAAAAQHWAAAEAQYRAALQAGGAALGGLRERCDVRYNHACCLARCGRPDEAAAIVRSLLALGGTTAADVQADPDLSGLPL